MPKNIRESDSYQRKNPEDQITLDKIIADSDTKDSNSKDKVISDTVIGEEMERRSFSGKDDFPDAQHARDANSRTIFRNPKLTCQFLRDYTGFSIFSDLRPEDIEDVTERYRAFLDIEFESDTVKKVRVRVPEGEREVFVIPLIEHKSRVDYDIAMQLLRYMVVIWYDYKKRQDKIQVGASSRKGFRYPLIIPILYYEGTTEWTADMRLSDRIDPSAGMEEYIPDFTYKVVRVHSYGNEELKKNQNEMSLVMMINRIQTPKDYTEFLESSKEYANEIYEGTSADIQAVYREVLWTLLRKMKVPVEEARQYLAEMEESGMGYLFENMEEMDIQEARRDLKEARDAIDEAKHRLKESNQELEESNQKLEESNQKLKESNQKLEESNQKLEKTNAKLNIIFGQLISICQSEHLSREETLSRLQNRYGLSQQDAAMAMDRFWIESA